MIIRRLRKTTLAAVLFAAIPLSTVNAVSTNPAPTPSGALNAAQATHLANLKTKGTAEIDRRLSNLNAALGKLNATTKLTSADKTALTGQINSEITGLTALKTKLTGDSDLTTARTDVQSIVSDYRVYVLLLPKTRLVASADHLTTAAGQLTTLEAKLQSKVDSIKSAGKDVTAEQKNLDDLKAKVADAQGKSIAVIAPLLALQPTDYNSNHAVLLTYRDSLRTAQSDVVAALADAKTVMQDLKTGATSASPSASPAK